MKNIQKQNFTMNTLLILLLILFFLSGSLMWSQHHQYNNTSWMGQDYYSHGMFSPLNGNNSNR